MDSSIRSSLRSVLRKCSRARKNSIVTAADAQAYFDWHYPSLDNRKRVSYINSILNNNSNEVIAVGETPSPREAARGRMITEWVFVS